MGIHEGAWKGVWYMQQRSPDTGPSGQGAAVIAAMVMGLSIRRWDMAQNNVRQWDQWYGMQPWRAAMLQPDTAAAIHMTFSTALQCGACLCVRV